jgi:LPS sulfotransferase NodH
VAAARRVSSPHVLELRYEELAGDPAAAAARLADHLGVEPEQLSRALAAVHDRSVGRYRRDLGPDQLADVEREAGQLLRELGYA